MEAMREAKRMTLGPREPRGKCWYCERGMKPANEDIYMTDGKCNLCTIPYLSCEAYRRRVVEVHRLHEAKRAASGFGADWSNHADAFNRAADANEATNVSSGVRAGHTKRARAENDENDAVCCVSCLICRR